MLEPYLIVLVLGLIIAIGVFLIEAFDAVEHKDPKNSRSVIALGGILILLAVFWPIFLAAAILYAIYRAGKTVYQLVRLALREEND